MDEDEKKLTVFLAPLRISDRCGGFWEGERTFPTMGSFLGPGGSLDRFVHGKISRTDIPMTSPRSVAEMPKIMRHGAGTTGMGKSGIVTGGWHLSLWARPLSVAGS